MKGHLSTRSNRPTRTIITAEQRALLNAAIEKVHYPSDDTIESLSNDLQISPSQIRIWFCIESTTTNAEKRERKYSQKLTIGATNIPATFSSSASGVSECNTCSSAMQSTTTI
ncbi:paired box protein Pax-3- partial [Lentinula edodes]|uniref:Paired box protein Pax-3-partial n=1 Tax=Lentinula edodes TaxID=5353 RepID=A0A1Q3EIT9_LENED|nr:paired box protein Pax-3- partial [Lentinula edodes]